MREWSFQFDSTVLALLMTLCDDVGDVASYNLSPV